MRFPLKTLALAAALGGASIGAARAQANAKEKLAAALAAIHSTYVDSVQDEVLADAAIRGMLTQLDPHSQYYDRAQIAERREAMSGNFVGIGIRYLVQHDTVYVTQVLPEGPAEKAGLLAGDRITQLDDVRVATAKLSNLDVQKKIRGEAGTPLRLEVYRGLRPAPLALTLVRGAVPDKSVKAAYLVTPEIGYIALAIFGQTTRADMDDALRSLQQQGMKSLILDLQGNGGGYVEAALGVADEFLKRDQLVYYTVGKEQGKDYYYAAGTGHFGTGKLVVLIDQATASSSEIVASALQDWDRAVLVGRRSFGKGLMQRPVPLFDGSVLELSGARYYAPSGRWLQKPYKGVNYPNELANRYASGEMYDGSVISFAKAPKFSTLASKRPVYGGLGIVPDCYVPLDSVQHSSWLQLVAGAGFANEAAFEVASRQRAALLKTYPDFTTFDQQYQVPAPLLETIVGTAARHNLHLSPAARPRTLELLAAEVKGRLAAQLYAPADYLRVVNQQNASVQQALRLLRNPAQYAQYLPPAPAQAATKSKKHLPTN